MEERERQPAPSLRQGGGGVHAPLLLERSVELPSSEDAANINGSHTANGEGVRSYPQGGQTSTAYTICNALNVLVGVGLLTVPYALATSGWSSLLLLTVVGGACCYTGGLLQECVSSTPECTSYPDIGQHAFGKTGRTVIAVLLYLELFSCAVEFILMPAENLAAIFPKFSFWGVFKEITPKQAFIVLSALLLTPLAWLRDMSSIALVSFSGLIASMASIVLVAWEGTAYTGLNLGGAQVPVLNMTGLPLTAGVYSFCFAGHAVFVSPLLTSMAKPKEYTFMLKVSFATALTLYVTMAVLGVACFGQDVRQQITLSMQAVMPAAFPTQAMLWIVIVSPLAKYPLTLAPVATALEGQFFQTPRRHRVASALIRTALVAGSACVAISIPFFAYLMSFIGAASSMTVCVILPCICYWSLMRGRLSVMRTAILGSVLVFGLIMASVGTYGSILRMYQEA